MQKITIGHLAKATGTKVETVRYYEQVGLMPKPARTRGNYRTYTVEHLNCLSFIRRARDLGFSIEQIRALLSLSYQKDRPCAAVDIIAREHLSEVERKIRDLQALRRELNNMIKQCGCGTIGEVPDHRRTFTSLNSRRTDQRSIRLCAPNVT